MVFDADTCPSCGTNWKWANQCGCMGKTREEMALREALRYFIKDLGTEIICPCCNSHPHIEKCRLKMIIQEDIT